jgi:malonyl-CoA O-methyltransferase
MTEAMLSTKQFKQQVITNFSSRAKDYDEHADIQISVANALAENIASQAGTLIDGPILEIGCGTGSLTAALVERFANRKIIASDISPPMLEKCRERLEQNGDVVSEYIQFEIIDGEKFEQPDALAAIVSSFTLQWLSNLDSTLLSLMRSLKQGGTFFFAVPSDQSFPQWKELCLDARVPFTGNPLPSLEFFEKFAEAYNYPFKIQQKDFSRVYVSMLHFLREIKAQGAATSLQGPCMQATQLRRLIHYSDSQNPQGLPMTYNIVFGTLTKR